jgi:hypothetical protein
LTVKYELFLQQEEAKLEEALERIKQLEEEVASKDEIIKRISQGMDS